MKHTYDLCFYVRSDMLDCEIYNHQDDLLHTFDRRNFTAGLILEWIDTLRYTPYILLIKITYTDPTFAPLWSLQIGLSTKDWKTFTHEQKVTFINSLNIPGLVKE